jgi:serine/threonine-protein kinase
MADAVLQRLGKYEIRSTLGKGAMGTVYEGWDPIIARRVAIKTVRLPDPADVDAMGELDRFRREAQAAGRLSHPNVVGVFDYGETPELAYIVMEFVDGRSWKSVLDGNERLPPAEVVRVMSELLAGLQYSHDRGVVHRDIKPANLILTQQGQTKIADFGIARIESSSMTQAGTVMGTPAYMSPEQFMGQTVDARTDIYSAGVVLYQLLTGERPFEGSMTAIMHKALNTQPPKPSELSVTAPAAFDAVVARAMAKRPQDRFASAAEFAEAIRAAEAAPAGVIAALAPEVPEGDATIVSAAPAPRSLPPAAPVVPLAAPVAPPAPPVPTHSRLPVLAGIAAVVLLLAGGGAWFALRGSGAPIPAAPQVAAALAPATPAPVATPLPPPPTDQPQSAPVAASSLPVASPPAAAQPAAAAAPAVPTVAPAAAPVSAPTPPAPPAAVKPPPVQLAMARTPDAIRRALTAALASVSCGLVRPDVTDSGSVTIAGMAGRGGPEAALRQAVASATPASNVAWRVATFDGPYCPALDLLRPISAGAVGLTLGLAGDRMTLRADELIIAKLVMPDFPAYLQVDYLASDGSVFHMHQAVVDGTPAYPAGAHVSLGDPGPGFKGWEVGEPFGRDMIIAVAAAEPLFPPATTESESAAAYLPSLRAAIERLSQRGVRVSGTATLLDTAAKP